MFLYNWIRTGLAYFGFKKNAMLLVVGPESSGKSTLISMLSTGKFVQHDHTERPYTQKLDTGLIRYTVCEMGGHPILRRRWKHYCSGSVGIIFMIDSADSEIFEEVKEELYKTIIQADLMPGVPVAILFNKIDERKAAGEDELTDKLNLWIHRTGKTHTPKAELQRRPIETFPCSVLKQAGYDEAMEWLAYYVD